MAAKYSLFMEARLPQDKLEKLRVLLKTTKRTMTLKQLQSLLGYLNFCCQVVLPGRPFLRRLIDLTKNKSKPNHYITLTKEHRRDVSAWSLFADNFNGKALLLDHRWIESDSLHMHTDASGSLGFGAILQKAWFYGVWPDTLKGEGITFKELFPIVIALEVWGSKLKNKCIVLHTDNIAVMHIINKQTAKLPSIMTLVRRLVLTCMKNNVLVKSEHIAGTHNVLPDLLSRLQVTKFRKLAPYMEKDPTTVPEHLLTSP